MLRENRLSPLHLEDRQRHYAMAENKVEFEVGKTEMLLFSRRRKVLQAATDVVCRIGEQSFAIQQQATKWLGFWLDSKLSLKTHFENRMASAKGALQRVASLSRSNGGLSVNLMRSGGGGHFRSAVWLKSLMEMPTRLSEEAAAAAQQPSKSHYRLIEVYASSLPQDQACLPCAKELLDPRETRYLVRALSADGDHLTHQLLPANFRLGELYEHESPIRHPSSTGWTRPEKTHRLFGSRLAQKVVKHVNYDKEHGFDLPYREDPPEAAPVIIRAHGCSRMPVRMLPDHPQRTTVFVEVAKDVNVGVGAAWKERDDRKIWAVSLGKYLIETDATLFAIGTVSKDIPSILQRTHHRSAEIVTKSRLALAEIQDPRRWVLRTTTDVKRHAKRIEEESGSVVLTWLPSSISSNSSKIASTAAQRAAR
jgi:hypothetical protein